MDIRSILRELKRRNIYKVAVAYSITGWIIIQVATNVFPVLEFPQWTSQFVILLVLIGFPFALVFAWAFEITPEGIQRTREEPAGESTDRPSGRSFNYWILGLLSLALVLLLVERIWWAGTYDTSSATENSAAQTTEVKSSVAVLPFEDFSPEADQQWFSDGLTEEILNSLARLPQLRVSARTSSFVFRDSNLPAEEIADSLQVGHVLEGSVRRFDQDMVVTVQLIRAEDGSHRWSRTYKRSVEDVFSVQKDIARQVASTLDIYLDADERERMFTFGTRNVQAYEAYLKGLKIYRQVHQEWELGRLWEANKWFERAYRRDSTFALAYHKHSDAFAHVVLGGMPESADTVEPKMAHEKLIGDLNQAIRYSDNEGVRLLSRFDKAFFSNDWSSLPEILDRIRNSSMAFQTYGHQKMGWTEVFPMLGHASLAHRLEREQIQKDPLSYIPKGRDAIFLISLGKTDSALVRYKQTPPSQQTIRAAILTMTGYEKRARKAWSQIQVNDSKVPHLALGFKLLFDQIQMSETELDRYIQRVVDKEIYRQKKSLLPVYILGGYDKKADTLARQIDTTLFGSQRFSLLVYQFGGRIPFDLAQTPNFARKLEEAGVETKPDTLYGMPVHRVVQEL